MFEFARVYAVHPESHTVDCLVISDGRRMPGVRVGSPFASGASGTVDLPEPVLGPGDDPALAPIGPREMFAVLVFGRGGMAVCPCFVYPHVAQTMFAEANLRLSRHVSGVYTLTDTSGNTEWRHPSGTRLRVGATADFKPLAGQDFDGIWDIPAGGAAHVRVVVANAGADQVTIGIDPSGHISLTGTGNLSLDVAGNLTLHADGQITIEAGGSVQISGSRIDLN